MDFRLPIRLDVAHELEALVRDHQAVPATIAIIDNEFCIGLNAEQLKRLTQENTQKASVRDLAVALTTGGVWATTVASTMYIASLASIRFFATGGIGGVHRNAVQTFDESADLLALAKYPVAVVSAGAKAILDLPKTVERLETLGVPILGYNTDSFPGFYCPTQDLLLKHRFTETATIAQVVHNRIDTLGQGGLLIVQDPPREAAQEPVHVEAKIRLLLRKPILKVSMEHRQRRFYSNNSQMTRTAHLLIRTSRLFVIMLFLRPRLLEILRGSPRVLQEAVFHPSFFVFVFFSYSVSSFLVLISVEVHLACCRFLLWDSPLLPLVPFLRPF